MLKKPEARIVVKGLKQRGFLKKAVLSEIEEDLTIYLNDDHEEKDLKFVKV